MRSRVTQPTKILVILTDQHRWDCVGAYGNSDSQTPNIAALAADGVRYAHAFCHCSACAPFHYSLLSGLYVHQHLGWSNHCTLPAGARAWGSQNGFVSRSLFRAGMGSATATPQVTASPRAGQENSFS
ncbi:MAG: sulfatase-like hydrolase/transferase [Lentisphaerae bacterium]|nr:sulfatase-like hydrolase/transferase [Lentisphaerota bacterium]